MQLTLDLKVVQTLLQIHVYYIQMNDLCVEYQVTDTLVLEWN